VILVDTWAWLALAVKRDQFHAIAKAQHQKFRKENRRYVTTDFIVSEVISRLYRTSAATTAQGYIRALLAKVDADDYLLVDVSPQQFRHAWQLRQKYHDKPDISFVDFSSMVIMQDLGIVDIFTGDEHFRQVNLGFQLHP
jgi:predicted nucleic acid-binding protein